MGIKPDRINEILKEIRDKKFNNTYKVGEDEYSIIFE